LAYIHHLVKAREVLGWQLLGRHNLTFYLQLMRTMRARILEGSFLDFYREQRDRLARMDEDRPPQPPTRKAPTSPTVATLGAFRVDVDAQNVGRIVHIASGEKMHSRSKPEEEARRLYVEQTRLEELLRQAGPPLVIWDVGLGAAANAMAAIRAAEALGQERRRELRVESFEKDLDALRLAVRQSRYFSYLWHPAPSRLLEQGSYSKNGIEWRLFEGDFREKLHEAAAPELIFFDPFSRKAEPEMWELSVFELLALELDRRKQSAQLITYSHSTAVRATALAAGFHVAQGVPSGEKEATTVAVWRPQSKFSWLDHQWLQRWEKSNAARPLGWTADRGSWEDRIRAHPQFQE
jgi:queuine tRNA-ribosyltransferase